MSEKKVHKRSFRFKVDFVPYQDTTIYRQEVENQPTIDLNKPDGINSSMKKGRQFRSIAYSGDLIENHPFWGNLIFDTANLRAKGQIPILLNHDHSKIVGSGSLRVDNSAIVVDGKIFHTSEHGKTVQNFADEGFEWQQSVHIEPEFIEKVPANKKVMVNSKEIKLDKDLTIFRNSIIKEVSFVPLGADSNTSANVFSDDNELITIKESIMSEVQESVVTTEETTITTTEPSAYYVFKDGEYKALEPATITVSKEDYDFACSCMEKDEKKKKFDDEVSQLKAEISSLKEELAKYKKQKRFELISSLETKLGTKFSDSSVEIMENLDEEKVESFAKDLMNSKTQEAHENLFKADQTEGKTFSVNKADPAEIRKAAHELVRKFAAEGKKLDIVDAIGKVVAS